MTRPRHHHELRAWRAHLVAPHVQRHDGVFHRPTLRRLGLTRDDIRTEVKAGRWFYGGRHTIVVGTPEPMGDGRLWRALWETGARAVLDGVAALKAAGLTHFDSTIIDVSIPSSSRRHRLPGVARHIRAELGPHFASGIPRAVPEQAVIRAAQWAVSDRQAALILCMTIQQRLTTPDRVLEAWSTVERGPRHTFLDQVIKDVCDGAESLGELDFAAECREVGLPEPTRQRVIRMGSRIYLDVTWDDVGLVVEIDGGHHAQLLVAVTDALRQNELVLTGRRVIRVPVIGFRLYREQFMQQVCRAYELAVAQTVAKGASVSALTRSAL